MVSVTITGNHIFTCLDVREWRTVEEVSETAHKKYHIAPVVGAVAQVQTLLETLVRAKRAERDTPYRTAESKYRQFSGTGGLHIDLPGERPEFVREVARFAA